MRCTKIPGWCNFDDLYRQMVANAPVRGAHFVEVGAWLGKSTCVMATAIRDSVKEIKFDVVDTWEGSPTEQEHQDAVAKLLKQGLSLFDAFRHNMEQTGAWKYIQPLRMTSVEASRLYAVESLDFVFIDADHRYELVAQDIRAWLPTIRPGGVLAGHDYQHPPVRRAVQELLPGAVRCSRSSWKYRKVA